MSKYAFPAVFTPAKEGGYLVVFPDIPACFTEGDTVAEALEMANDVLCLMLYDMEENGKKIPLPSDINKLEKSGDSFTSMIACDTLEYRKFYDNKSVKKTLTIPSWLNSIAEKNNINFSSVLQEALMQKLHILS